MAQKCAIVLVNRGAIVDEKFNWGTKLSINFFVDDCYIEGILGMKSKKRQDF